MRTFLFLIIVFIATGLYGQYLGPVPVIASGYGSEGLSAVSVVNIRNDHFYLKDISVFYPEEATSPRPTIFFSHGYGGTDTTNYIETLRNLASNGYAVVFVPYKTVGVTLAERYLTLYDGFIKASQTLTSIIDTSRVGFFGHSFGGGATPRITYRLFTENGWGVNGKFIYLSAPWYALELGDSNLSDFPKDCNMLTVLFDNDDVNDHRLGMDVFNNIAIGDSIKDCVIVFGDTISGYIYEAGHSLPAQYSPNGSYDAHDFYVTFRLLGALADFTFTGSQEARNIALGNGSPEQIDMGSQLRPLKVTDDPSPIYPESKYDNPCGDDQNERQEFCQASLGISGLEDEEKFVEIFPNPTRESFIVDFEGACEKLSVSLLSISGEEVLMIDDEREIDISSLTSGIYFAVINVDGYRKVKKLIKIE